MWIGGGDDSGSGDRDSDEKVVLWPVVPAGTEADTVACAIPRTPIQGREEENEVEKRSDFKEREEEAILFVFKLD